MALILLTSLATLLSLLVLSALAARIHAISKEDLVALNRTVNGRLQVGFPFARPCFGEGGPRTSFDATECARIMIGYGDPVTRGSAFGAYMNPQWETCQATSEQCLLNFFNVHDRTPVTPPRFCAQGSVSPYYIEVQDASDVQAAFRFSVTHGVPLAIKNTGHDYTGRSSAPNSLALWTHHLRNLSYHVSFAPVGCRSNTTSQAVTMGAGVTQGELYDFADSHGVMVPGGAEKSVGAIGGYLQGGGHGVFANAFGLAVDNVLQFKIVTPRGDYLTTNACQNSDLFFALRGGGGGTFGVVMEATLRARPRMSFPVVVARFGNLTDASSLRWLEFLTASAVKFAETGWGGYINIHTDAGMIFANPLISESQAEAEMRSLQTFVKSMNGTFALTTQPSFRTFVNMFLSEIASVVPVGLPFTISSRLIPASAFSSQVKQLELATILYEVYNLSATQTIFAVTPFLHSDDGQTSVTPAWRDAIWHVAITAEWNFDASLSERIAAYATLSAAMDIIRFLTPGSGAYQNEADVYEPDHTSSFWGSNYARLVDIKRKYDPQHLLDCWHCVDSRGNRAEQFSCYL